MMKCFLERADYLEFLHVNILELIFIQNIEICVHDKYLGANGYKGLRILYLHLR